MKQLVALLLHGRYNFRMPMPEPCNSKSTSEGMGGLYY